jgi:hypothetical protein
MASGILQQAIGYQRFFMVALAASVIPVIVAWKAPFPVGDAPEAKGSG